MPQCGSVETVLTATDGGVYTFVFEHIGTVRKVTQTRAANDKLILTGSDFNERARITGYFLNSSGERVEDENGVSDLFVEVKPLVE